MAVTKLYDQVNPTFPVTLSSLNGDNDVEYLIEWDGDFGVPSAVEVFLVAVPNGAAITVNAVRLFSGATGTAGGSYSPSGFPLAKTDWTLAQKVFSVTKISAKTGKSRQSMCQETHRASDGNIVAGLLVGYWPDTTTNITSLVFQAFGGTVTITGRLIVWKVVP